MDNKDYDNALKRIKDLQGLPDMDEVLQDELDKLITQVNKFEEKNINFD